MDIRKGFRWFLLMSCLSFTAVANAQTAEEAEEMVVWWEELGQYWEEAEVILSSDELAYIMAANDTDGD